MRGSSENEKREIKDSETWEVVGVCGKGGDRLRGMQIRTAAPSASPPSDTSSAEHREGGLGISAQPRKHREVVRTLRRVDGGSIFQYLAIKRRPPEAGCNVGRLIVSSVLVNNKSK